MSMFTPATPVAIEHRITGLSAIDLFAAAERAKLLAQDDDALAIYDALTRDPDPDIRAEARFRKGMMLTERKRYTEAATAFRAVLDEKPDAAGVRLELARALAALGDEAAARRAIRQARASGLPLEVALAVDQFANALRSPKALGGSIELALAPDTNANRATSARTLDTVIAPLTLSKDARASSSIGVTVSSQVYGHVRLDDRLAVVPRASALGNFYSRREFEDVSSSALLGLDWRDGGTNIVTSFGYTWRWYAHRLYARTQTVNIDLVRALTARSQLTVRTSASRARYAANASQDGALYDLQIGYERAVSARSGAGLSIVTSRQAARDRGYSTLSGGVTSFAWLEVNHVTVFGSATLRRLVGDAKLFLFTDRRQDWLFAGSAGATFRQLTIRGFAPFARLSVERNRSSVGIYDYKRLSASFGLSRAF
jgi:tetratricopeptide (TPR) repeat protein